LEHPIKVVERIFEDRIQQQIDIDDMQFGFMKGNGTTDAIFIVRQIQEKFRAKRKKLYLGFLVSFSSELLLGEQIPGSPLPNSDLRSQCLMSDPHA